jgi:cytochrome c553
MTVTRAGLALFTLVWVLAACAGAPTMTPTSGRVIDVPTFQFTPPTVAPQIATAAATRTPRAESTSEATADPAPAFDPVRIQRGRERYEALSCWGCHGENAEGGSASALNNLTMSEDEFITAMRAVITLDDGTIHQFSTNLLSDNGGRNLYLYLISLRDAAS